MIDATDDPPVQKQGRLPTLAEWEKAQKPGVTRLPSLEEWKQAQGMSPRALREWKLPAIPMAMRDNTRTKVDAINPGGTRMLAATGFQPEEAQIAAYLKAEQSNRDFGKDTPGLRGVLSRQLIAPALSNPFETVAMLAAVPAAAALSPIAAVGVGGAMAGSMVYHIAQYGWQKAAELSLDPEDRKRAEEDPDRVSGEAAVVQAIGVGLAALVHVGVKSVRGPGFGEGMVESGARGLSAMDGPRKGTLYPQRFAKPAEFAADLEEGAATAKVPRATSAPPGFQPTASGARLATNPRGVKGYAPNNPFNSIPSEIKVKPTATEPPAVALEGAAETRNAVTASVKEYEGQRVAEDLSDLNAEKKVDLIPRRRAKPATNFFESETGAETLGAAAGRHGLPEEANPYHPDSHLAATWTEGHQAATESFPEGFSAGADLNAPSRIPPGYKAPRAQGGIDGLQQSLPVEVPEGVTPETLALSEALKPSPYRGHSIDELANEVIATQKAITDAQKAIERTATSDHVKFEDPVTAEKGQFLFEDRGREAHEWLEAEVHKKAIKAGMTRLAKLERELAMRGVSGDELADVMKGANERHLEREGMQQEESLARGTGEPAPVADPVAAESGSARGLAPVEGTGETVTRGTARSVEARAVMNGLTTGFDGLPEYNRVSFADQGLAAVDFLARDPEAARAVALGEAPAPHGLLPEAVSIALENKATAEGDVATIDALTHSRLVEEGTTMGQRIGINKTRNAESAVDALQEIAAVATKGKDVPKMTKAEIASMEKHMTKVDVAWKKFVDQLRCS